MHKRPMQRARLRQCGGHLVHLLPRFSTSCSHGPREDLKEQASLALLFWTRAPSLICTACNSIGLLPSPHLCESVFLNAQVVVCGNQSAGKSSVLGKQRRGRTI